MCTTSVIPDDENMFNKNNFEIPVREHCFC